MYIKRVELTNFKSFGGTTGVPLLPGFTVISGPNGSGKSNILDALLFCLGLSSSKGMRAERLPDLVNQAQASRNRTVVEASVTVTFALDEEDWRRDEVNDKGVRNETNAAADGDALGEALLLSEADDSETGSETDLESHSDSDAETETEEVPPSAPDAADSPQNGSVLVSQNGHSESSNVVPLVPMTEWIVTRKLRVTQQGAYTSSYAMNGVSCTLTELHEQLHKLRIYPEGYNVVLQGDVTSIISMNPRERREIIDELAGVGAFDRKIGQAKGKLDEVKEREEKFRIVERELIAQRDRLAQDRIKAEKYQRLRAELENKSQWESILVWRAQERQAQQIRQQIEAGDREHTQFTEQLTALTTQIQQSTTELERLNAHVKALGEDEQLALQSTLATREAELRQLQRQEQDLINAKQETEASIERTQREIQEQLQQSERLTQEQQHLEQQELATLRQARDAAQQALEQSRENSTAIAAASDAWIQEQTALRRQIEALQQTLEPQRTEQARLQERVEQLRQKIQEQNESLTALATEIAEKQAQQTQGQDALQQAQKQAESAAQKALTQAEQELKVHQETQERLIQEQRDKQRQLDKLEAQAQAIQETQGTGIIEVLSRAKLSGICGLVAQLGRVEPQYQLALEIAAGARLAHLVVDDDGVAAKGIEILKQKRAGRATFLPLNKIRAPQFTPTRHRPEGFIDYACNLIECDDRYQEVFAYVFGSTVVFSTLQAARREMGSYRIVTLEGELLESSGAMTGGSSSRHGSLHFGRVEPAESAEAVALRDRLQEIDRMLSRMQETIAQAVTRVKECSQAQIEGRQHTRELQLQAEQLQNQLATLVTQEGQIRAQLSQNTQELTTAQDRLHTLEQDLPLQEADLQQQRQTLATLEETHAHSEWQQIQAGIRQLETELSDRQLALQSAEQRLTSLDNQRQRLQGKTEQLQQRLQENRAQQTTQMTQQATLSGQQTALVNEIAQVKTALAALEQTLAAEKQQRDRAERQLREQQTQQQQITWQQQKLVETQQARREELTTLQAQLEEKRAELPDPLPEIPETLGLEQLQQELRSLQKRLQAMEPVNMLALEEYDRTQARLEELSQKLATLDEERTELLLRIENFTTLRQKAFKEAFDAVNQNFQSIFATLSDGDGYLQLDDPQDPFGSGLNLVAHPKGKPVRRLASMSGGEKSLTALSFIFALQRYRPSPFYAFDEVDMFLDGANVERLAKMIKHQAQQAQFIVVSLRRPMIESAERTIGVTQARGAYTQVLGLSLQPQSASV
ncbi:MAG: chromosome segregation protein SMC [Oculatellaceae cyanobacterium Prado106]|nr:chromosome segregation protein SMC [Oculatellaceae cyanobacterium Prado106]